MPTTFPTFCMATGVINTFADSSLNLYLLYFIVYTLLNMKTSIKTKQVINKKILHSSVVIFSIAWVLFLSLDGRITITQFGLCGISNLRYNTIQWFFPIFQIIQNLAFLLFALYTFYYFRKHMPVNEILIKRIYYQNQAISFFVAIQTVVITLFDASIGIAYFNCFRQQPLTWLLAFCTIMNASRLGNSIFLLYFIMRDQTIKKKTKRFVRRFFQQAQKSNSQSFILDIKDIDFSQDHTNDLDLDITLKQRILQLKQQQHQIDLYKIAQIATMISGICIAHLQYFNTKTFSSFIKKLHFKQKIVFNIEPKTLIDYGIDTNKIPKAGILKGTITMIAPRIFNKLLHSDGLIEVEKSFDLMKNYHKMYNIAEGKGGKSGQFFFFSYDNKYVLKTITKQQYTFLVQNLQQFFQYYQKNPKSLLSKIYGIYTIKGQYIGKQYDLILMKNIFGCQKDQILRTYDLKGSKHDRQVIKQSKQNLTYNQLEKLTLKDTDFIKLESKLYVPREKIRELRHGLRKDTLFLKNFNLIDYSLLVIRVKWPQPPQNQNFWNTSQRIQSSRNPQQYYHIGLIDYMQGWNISKKSQNWFKSLIGKKQISAQQPNFYQKRFMGFIEEITYWPDQARSDLGEENSNYSDDIQSHIQDPSERSYNQNILASIEQYSRTSKKFPSKSKIKTFELQLQKLKAEGKLRKTSFQTQQGYIINIPDPNSPDFKSTSKFLNLNQTIQQYRQYFHQNHIQIPKQLSDIDSKSSIQCKNALITSFQGQLFFRKNNLLSDNQRFTQSQHQKTQHQSEKTSPPQFDSPQSPVESPKHKNKFLPSIPRQIQLKENLQKSKGNQSILGSSYEQQQIKKHKIVTFNRINIQLQKVQKSKRRKQKSKSKSKDEIQQYESIDDQSDSPEKIRKYILKNQKKQEQQK